MSNARSIVHVWVTLKARVERAESLKLLLGEEAALGQNAVERWGNVALWKAQNGLCKGSLAWWDLRASP